MIRIFKLKIKNDKGLVFTPGILISDELINKVSTEEYNETLLKHTPITSDYDTYKLVEEIIHNVIKEKILPKLMDTSVLEVLEIKEMEIGDAMYLQSVEDTNLNVIKIDKETN